MDYQLNALNNIRTTQRDLTVHLVGPELRLALNPRVQLYSFYQYNSLDDVVRLNARFSWEFRPLSFFYVVWNENSFKQLPLGRAETFRNQSQQAIVKLSYVHQL